MRTEGNPIKQNPALSVGYKRHRIIMPVFIPSHEGYYKDAFKIFKICLQSLIDTTDRKFVNITIINNASVPEVNDLVNEKLVAGEVDQYIHNQVNRGKADAIVGAAKASYEPFITIADADVLFDQNWLTSIENIYRNFSYAGAVSPFPASNLKFSFTSSVWLSNFMRIKYGKVIPDSVFVQFEKSLGLQGFFKKDDISGQFYLKRNNSYALVGSGHFVCTYRNEVFKHLRYAPITMGLKGGLRLIDANVDRLGFWRLSVFKPHVYHMGNILDVDASIFKRSESVSASHYDLLVCRNPFLIKLIPFVLRKKIIFVINALYRLLNRRER